MTTGKPAMCSGCMASDAIGVGDLHLSIKGLLLLKADKVVTTQLRFCLGEMCVTNFRSPYHNVRPFVDGTVLKKLPVTILTAQQIANVQLEGFEIENVPLIRPLRDKSSATANQMC